ncbi:hypothetical protein [Methylobacter sp. S3L5C]|nr:hypothetical protein [Methylobacter sp. S3L5C]UOA08071.1 hypothetical protein KKZ03_17830 [Methylobacter sp. S3L5C]
MNKPIIKSDQINATTIMYGSLTMVFFGLLVSWGVERLMKELFQLG